MNLESRFLKSVLKAQIEIFKSISFDKRDEFYEKRTLGEGGDISTGIDIYAEEIFIRELIDFGEIRSEEIGVVGAGEYIIYIDPIDGSDNFLSNFPYFGSSVALCDRDENPIVGVISNFANGDLFIKDSSGFRVGKIGSDRFDMANENRNSKVGLFEKAYANCQIAMELAINRVKFRSPGALALSLAYANEVDFVLFSGEAREYDIKAGLFMCENLHIDRSDKYILVSKNRDNFECIQNMIKGKNGIC